MDEHSMTKSQIIDAFGGYSVQYGEFTHTVAKVCQNKATGKLEMPDQVRELVDKAKSRLMHKLGRLERVLRDKFDKPAEYAVIVSKNQNDDEQIVFTIESRIFDIADAIMNMEELSLHEFHDGFYYLIFDKPNDLMSLRFHTNDPHTTITIRPWNGTQIPQPRSLTVVDKDIADICEAIHGAIG